MVWSAWLTGPVISDSWQSIGPCVESRWPLDLRGLYLGDFDGYERTWGHHWPGWPMFMSFFTSWVKFDSKVVFTISALITLLCAFIFYLKSWNVCGKFAACAMAGIILLFPDTNVALSMMRPEPLGSLLFFILAFLFIETNPSRARSITLLLLSAFSPFLHILSAVAVFSLIVCFILMNRLSLKEMKNDNRWVYFKNMLVGWIIGCGGLVVWFVGDQSRFSHIKQNLMAQKLSYHSLFKSLSACYFQDVTGYAISFTFLTIIVAAGCLIVKRINHRRFYLWASAPIICVLFSFITENPNRLHLITIFPAALMALVVIYTIMPVRKGVVLAGILMPLFVGSLAFHFNRIARLAMNGVEDNRSKLGHFLNSQKGDHQTYISVSLWESAANSNFQNCVLYTFPNVAHPDYRLLYEKEVFSHAAVGDRIVLDVSLQSGGSNFFMPESFARLTSVNPYEIGVIIEEFEVIQKSKKITYHVIEIRDTATLRKK